MDLMNDLIDAFSNEAYEHRYYLDIETGKVVMDLDESLFDEPESEWDENTNIDRYLEIPRATSSDHLHLMQQFAKETQEEKLLAALAQSEPFKAFNEVIKDTELAKKWAVFQNDYFKEQILDWLDVEELSYEKLKEKREAE